MKEYVIEKDTNFKRVGKKRIVIEGNEIKTKLKKHPSLIAVDSVVVISPKLYENALQKQFNLAYKKIFKKVMIILEEDSTGAQTALALDEVAKMKAVLNDKYKHHVSKQEYHKMWKKLSILQGELQQKQEIIRNIENLLKAYTIPQIYEEERGKSR